MLRPSVRWAFTFVAAVLVGAWAASHAWTLWAYPGDMQYFARLVRGRFVYGTYETLQWPRAWPRFYIRDPGPDDTRFVLCHESQLNLPVGPLAGTAAAASAGLWVLAVRRRDGRCRSCGYPVAGLAAPVCPECGRAVTA